jgi:outer membrane protein TolC
MMRLLTILQIGFVLAASQALAFEAKVSDQVEFYSDDPLLEEYVRSALQRNPALLEAIARYRASLQKARQVTALPDPTFSFNQFIRSVETRVGPQLNTFAISQKFPWFGKLDLKGQVAVKQAAARYQAFRAQERRVIAAVKRAFYELTYIDQALGINREEELLLDHYEQLSQAQYSQGDGLQQAIIKIQAELTQILDRNAVLTRQRASLVAQLNNLMGHVPEQSVPPLASPILPEVNLDLDLLYKLGELNRHELKGAMARIETEERAVELAKKDFWPDVTLSAGFINVGGRNDLPGEAFPPPDNGKNAFSLSIGVNLPIWRDKYNAGVLEATESAIAERHQYVAIRNEMEFSIRDQVVRLETLWDQLGLYEQVLIPQAEQTLRSSESVYETGQLSVLELLDSERFLLRARLIRARYKADYLRALTDLEQAVGTRFPNS